MVRYHSCIAVLDLTDAQIILKGKNKFFLLLLTTLSMKGFCREKFLWKTHYICMCVYSKHLHNAFRRQECGREM